MLNHAERVAVAVDDRNTAFRQIKKRERRAAGKIRFLPVSAGYEPQPFSLNQGKPIKQKSAGNQPVQKDAAIFPALAYKLSPARRIRAGVQATTCAMQDKFIPSYKPYGIIPQSFERADVPICFLLALLHTRPERASASSFLVSPGRVLT
jgi:hypothetical protein